MKLFGRKTKEADHPSSEATEGQGKPKRRRRRKDEPSKPWGKWERLLVFGVLSSTIFVAIILALNAREGKLPGLPRISIPKVFEETYVFEGKPVKRDTSRIISEFYSLTKNLSGVYGFYVINLNTDEAYGIDENEIFQAASLIKLPVMLAMYSEHERENTNLDDIYSLKEEDKVGGSGSIANKEAGARYSYRELVSAMGKESDNTAFNVSVKLLGEDFIDEFINEIGMSSTSYEKNETTPRDVGIFFKRLWSGKVVEKSSRDEILKFLTDTIYEDYIPAGIDVRVAHKFGRELHVINDAGIVFGNDPYVLVIMSKGVLEKEANQVIPEIASLIHRFESADN